MPIPALIAGGALLLGAGINAIMQWQGAKKQAAENERINRLSIGEAAKERKLTAKGLELQGTMGMGQLRLARKKQAWTEEETAKDREERDEMTKYNKTLGFVANFQGMMRANPAARDRLINIQKTRRA